MTERFTAIRGEVYDQTTLPAHILHLDDARQLAKIWQREAQDARARGAYEQVKLWSVPAATLVIAIEAAVAQRQMMGPTFKESAR